MKTQVITPITFTVPDLIKRIVLAASVGVLLVAADMPARAAPSGSFVPTGSLAGGGRVVHPAVRLPDGRVFVVGGIDAQPAGTVSSEIYDPSSGIWSVSGSMGTARVNNTANVLPDGRVLVMGGGNGVPIYNSTEIWDPTTGEFTPGPPMNVVRAYHQSIALRDGRILVVGGISTAKSVG